MSRKILGIVLVAAAVSALVLFFLYMTRDTKTPPEEQSGTEFVQSAPEEGTAVPAKSGTQTDGAEEDSETQTDTDYQFVLVNSDNYVAVYRLPENEIYEYTDVILDVLPAELQEEIQEGKYLKNEEELYNFLENYTS